MKISARTKFLGKVPAILAGAAGDEVEVTLDLGKIRGLFSGSNAALIHSGFRHSLED